MDETYFYRHADGSYSTVTVSGIEHSPAPPEDAVEITEAEYNEGVAAIEAANAQQVAEQEAAAQERARQDYEALIAAGIPAETAARMSGYTPPHPTVGGTQKKGR
ncbi:hypothetical protein ACFVT1_36235 [Streptomyces sp. NPDC057963]|uniref:hypothetical protein n=1 Tax=Streptomyces sp. NPDC057963 TaxID=3346290 RepID=UPI0036EA1410